VLYVREIVAELTEFPRFQESTSKGKRREDKGVERKEEKKEGRKKDRERRVGGYF